MRRLGFLSIVLMLACNSSSDGDTDSGNNSGSAGGSSSSSSTGETMTATESETANTDTASATGSSSSGTTSGASGSGADSSTSEGSSSSTGAPDPAALCESTDGTWDEAACGHYACGVPNDCDAVIPGCDCGPDSNFVEGEGCVEDPLCNTFQCSDELDCVVALEYCEVSFPGQKGAPITYACVDMPKACADMVDCTCLEDEIGLMPPGDCTEPVEDGLVVQVFLP